MRILLITDDYLPHQGGSRVYYHNLMTRLDGIEGTVLTKDRPGADSFDRSQPYRIVRCPLQPWPFLRPLRMQFLPLYASLLAHGWRAVRRFRPDVIVAGELVPTGPVAAVLAEMFHLPLIAMTHAEGPSTLAKTRWQSRLARWVCRRARTVIANSDYCRRLLVSSPRNLPESRIRVILPGVAEEHFDSSCAASPCGNSGVRRILSVARLVERKSHVHLLRALPSVLKVIPDLEYIIVGTGPLENALKREAIALGVHDHVRFAGKLSDAELQAEYARSDCFVLPNVDNAATGDTEGFGIVFVEASAHGLPVIGGRTEGTEKAILHNRTGLRVNGENRKEITAAIIRVLTEPELAQSLGRQGREYALASMRWDDRAEVFRQVLKDSCER